MIVRPKPYSGIVGSSVRLNPIIESAKSVQKLLKREQTEEATHHRDTICDPEEEIIYSVRGLVENIDVAIATLLKDAETFKKNRIIQKKSSLSLPLTSPITGIPVFERVTVSNQSDYLDWSEKDIVQCAREIETLCTQIKSLSIGRAKGRFLAELGEDAVRNEWEYKTAWTMCELFRTTFMLFRPEKKRPWLLNMDSYLGGLFNYCLNLGFTEATWFDRIPVVKTFALETRERYVDSNVKGFEKTRNHEILDACPAKFLAQISTWSKALPQPPTMEVDLAEWIETFHPTQNPITEVVASTSGKIVAKGTPKEFKRALQTIPNGLQDIKNIFRCTSNIASPTNLGWLKHSGCFERTIEAGGALKVLSTMISSELKEYVREEADVLKRLQAQIVIFDGLLRGSLEQNDIYMHDCPEDVRKCEHAHPPLLHLPVLSRGFKARHLTMSTVAIRFVGSTLQKYATKWLRNMPVTAELLQPTANWAKSIDRAYQALHKRFPGQPVYLHSGDLVGCTNNYLKEISREMIMKGFSFFANAHPEARKIVNLVLGSYRIYLSHKIKNLEFRDNVSVIDGFEEFLNMLDNSKEGEEYFRQLIGQHMGMPLSFPVMGGMHQALYDVVYPPERYELDSAPLFDASTSASSPRIRQILGRASHRRCAGKMQVQLGVDEQGGIEHNIKMNQKYFEGLVATIAQNDAKQGKKATLTAAQKTMLVTHQVFQSELARTLMIYRLEINELRKEFPDLEFIVIEKQFGAGQTGQKTKDGKVDDRSTANGTPILLPELSEYYSGQTGKPFWENKSAYLHKYAPDLKVKLPKINSDNVKGYINFATVGVVLVIEFSIKTATVPRNYIWASDSEVEDSRLDCARDLTTNGRYIVQSCTYQRRYTIESGKVISTGNRFIREAKGYASSAGDDLAHITADLRNVQAVRTRGTTDFNQKWNKKADYCSTKGYVIAENIGRVNTHTGRVFPEFYVKIKQLVTDQGSQQIDSWMERAASIRIQLLKEFNSWTTESRDPSREVRRHLYRIIENAEEILYYNNKKGINWMIYNSLDPRLEPQLGGCGVWKGIQAPFSELTLEHLRVLTYLSKYERCLLPKYVKQVHRFAMRHRVSRPPGRTKQIVKPGPYEIPRCEFKELYYSLLGWVDQLEDETSIEIVRKETVAHDVSALVHLWSRTIKSFGDGPTLAAWSEIKKVWVAEYLPGFTSSSGVGTESPVTMAFIVGNANIPQGTNCVYAQTCANRLYGEVDLSFVREHIKDDPRVMSVDEKGFQLFTQLKGRKQELIDEISTSRNASDITKVIKEIKLSPEEIDPYPAQRLEQMRMVARLNAKHQRSNPLAHERIIQSAVDVFDLPTAVPNLGGHGPLTMMSFEPEDWADSSTSNDV